MQWRNILINTCFVLGAPTIRRSVGVLQDVRNKCLAGQGITRFSDRGLHAHGRHRTNSPPEGGWRGGGVGVDRVPRGAAKTKAQTENRLSRLVDLTEGLKLRQLPPHTINRYWRRKGTALDTGQTCAFAQQVDMFILQSIVQNTFVYPAYFYSTYCCTWRYAWPSPVPSVQTNPTGHKRVNCPLCEEQIRRHCGAISREQDRGLGHMSNADALV